MKHLSTMIMILMLALALSAAAQDKPRVFVQGKGSEDLVTSGSGGGGRHWGAWGSNSTFDSHDEGMEVTKDLQKNCLGVTVTLNQSNADYTIMLNRESKHNRGLLRTNSQIQVANRAGDILGTNATRTVSNAAKDACELVLSDWQTHGRVAPPASGSAAATPASAPAIAPPQAQPDQPAQQAAAQPQQPAISTTAPEQQQPVTPESLGDAARRAKQHQACVEMAKDNPSITCK
jgi:hypothetical protein